jgi:hypothetical protein
MGNVAAWEDAADAVQSTERKLVIERGAHP